MKSKILTPLLLLILLAYSTLVLSQDFKVSPSLINLNLSPGESYNETITLENNSDSEQSFLVSTKDLTFDDHGKMLFEKAGSSSNSCAKYITITPAFVALNPNESVQINILVDVPVDAQQTKWGVVVFRPEQEFTAIASDLEIVNAGLLITPEIAVKVIQSPPNITYKKISILNFAETTQSLTDSLNVFTVKVQNEGDLPTAFKVYVSASNLETLDELVSDPVNLDLLPSVKSELRLSLPTKLSSGSYSVVAIVDYGEEYDLEGMELELTVKEE